MKFVAMAIQDHNEVSMYNGLPLETEVSLSHQLFSASSVHQKEHISSGKDNNRTPKVRKPYTITKQRERWTEDEHQKFLEALKLHGRAWRKIEEHIGTKTAVQIRSHAQKYFTKLIREASGSSIISTTESFEIPPPRPKRRPSHPYPRKRIEIPEKEISIEGHTMRSNSLKSSDLSDQEDQSPKSVLSIIGLDNLRGPSEEDDPTPNADSPFVLQTLPKFKLFPKKSSPAEEDMVEELNGKVVKLFGANLLATKKNSDIAEAPIGFVPRRTLVEDKAEKESSWCGSNITSSMNEGENDDDDDDENTDPVEARSHMDCDVKGEQLSLFGRYMTTPSEPSTISELLERPKGFVPYKKFIAEKENKPLPLTVEERDGQCFRLFL